MATYTFRDAGLFEAATSAEMWCSENGYSVGRMQGKSPRGLLRGNYDIQKWRNLTAADRAALDGTMTGDMRNGPVVVWIKEPCVAAAE